MYTYRGEDVDQFTKARHQMAGNHGVSRDSSVSCIILFRVYTSLRARVCVGGNRFGINPGPGYP